MAWQKVLDGWQIYLDHLVHGGTYWFKESDIKLYKKQSDVPPLWTECNELAALQALPPVPMDTMAKSNAVTYDVLIKLAPPRQYTLQAKLPDRTHFDVPCTAVTPDLNLEECYVSYALAQPLTGALGGLSLSEAPPDLPIRLIFGYQSSINAHSGFGLFHIMSAHGRSFGWSFATLDAFLKKVFQGYPGREFLIFKDSDHDARWILGPVAKARQIIPGTGAQKVHFMVVLEQKEDCFKIVTAFPKGYVSDYRIKAQEAISGGVGATFTLGD